MTTAHNTSMLRQVDRVGLCIASLLQSEQLRVDIWERVERQLGIGLRSSDPELRAKFFKLYNGHMEPTLFERLKFIVCVQSWEEMAGTFWLKQGLVSYLRVVKAAAGLSGRGLIRYVWLAENTPVVHGCEMATAMCPGLLCGSGTVCMKNELSGLMLEPGVFQL